MVIITKCCSSTNDSLSLRFVICEWNWFSWEEWSSLADDVEEQSRCGSSYSNIPKGWWALSSFFCQLWQVRLAWPAWPSCIRTKLHNLRTNTQMIFAYLSVTPRLVWVFAIALDRNQSDTGFIFPFGNQCAKWIRALSRNVSKAFKGAARRGQWHLQGWRISLAMQRWFVFGQHIATLPLNDKILCERDIFEQNML
jgi:hypothetical protein